MTKAVETCALYAIGATGSVLCTEIVEVVLHVLEVKKDVRYVL